MVKKHFLLIDDEANTVSSLLESVYGKDCIFHYINLFDKSALFTALGNNKNISVILVDIYGEGETFGNPPTPAGISLLNSLKNDNTWATYSNTLSIVVMTKDPHISTKLQASRWRIRYRGKNELLNKESKPLIGLWEESQNIRKYNLIPQHFRDCDFIYDPDNPEIRAIFDNIRKVAKFDDVPILIRGDTGSGKELLAKAIWEEMKIRRGDIKGKGGFKPFNIASVSPQLLHSEFFGYLGSSFTDANRNGKKGIFQVADEENATLFLDEIGDAPHVLQVALLRVLQSDEIVPTGAAGHGFVDDKTGKLDAGKTLKNIRLIFATHKDLEGMIRKKELREDLFHRMNVFPIHIPPLKSRRGEIPLLAEHFRLKFNEKYKMDLKYPDYSDFMEILKRYDWPGNVRELEHDLLRSYIISSERPDKTIQLAKDVEDKLLNRKQRVYSNIQDFELMFNDLPKNPEKLTELAKKYGQDTAVKLGRMLINKSNNSWPDNSDTEKYFGMKGATFRKWMNGKGVKVKTIKNKQISK
jgi:transcriptional regulator with GAF, ATPase, and Fis domain